MSKAKTYNYQDYFHLAALYRFINCSIVFKMFLFTCTDEYAILLIKDVSLRRKCKAIIETRFC